MFMANNCWRSLLITCFFIKAGFCCFGGGGGGAPGTTLAPGVTQAVTSAPSQGNQGSGNQALDQIGGLDNIGSADSGTFTAKNGKADSPSDLNCNFETDCCWTNEQPPKDQLDYSIGSSFRNPTAFQAVMGQPPPTTRVLIIGAGPTQNSDIAIYKSCYLECAENVQLSLRYWMSSSVSLQVCLANINDPTGQLLNCQPLSRSNSPGPVTLQFPPMQNQYFAIDASGFGTPGVVIVDDITVQGSSTTGSCSPKPKDGGACAAAACSFAADNCAYTPGGPPSGTQTPTKGQGWTHRNGPIPNALTGVPKLPPNNAQGYSATYLFPQEGATMTSGDFNAPQNLVLSYDYLEATANEVLELHLDSPDSAPVWQTSPINAGARGWHHNNVLIPAGTKKLYWVAKDTGNLQGAAAVANIDILQPGPNGGADNPGGSLCTPSRKQKRT